MSVKTIGRRVEDAFQGVTDRATQAREYLELIDRNLREVAATVRRDTMLLVILVLAFFLLAHAHNVEFTLGPLKVTNIVAVLTLIPPIVAVLMYEIVALAAMGNLLTRTASAVLSVISPAIVENELDRLISPPGVHMLETQTWREVRTLRPRGHATRALEALGTATTLVLLLGSFGFLGYAYFTLYEDRHANTLTVSVSLAVSAIMLLRTVLEIADEQEPGGSDA